MGLNIVVIMSLFMLPLSGWLCHSSKLTGRGRNKKLGEEIPQESLVSHPLLKRGVQTETLLPDRNQGLLDSLLEKVMSCLASSLGGLEREDSK
jgi:hypothetical protein